MEQRTHPLLNMNLLNVINFLVEPLVTVAIENILLQEIIGEIK